jgi:CPA2 family monovalent cation:H+ antiporter-2
MAGTIIGPLLFKSRAVFDVAELGVALLLFSIGLEFSFRRLKSMGIVALAGGSLQVAMTLGILAGLLGVFMAVKSAVVLGAIAALSSTAVVLRVLVDRAEIDSVRFDRVAFQSVTTHDRFEHIEQRATLHKTIYV